LIALQSYAGLGVLGDKVKINPNLPKFWNSIKFNFTHRNKDYSAFVTNNRVDVKLTSGSNADIEIGGKTIKLNEQEPVIVEH